MSVTLGLDPVALLELDEPMFAALERAAAERWTVADELRAIGLELAHDHYVAFLKVHGAKRVPERLRVPRPDDTDFGGPPVLAAADFAAAFGPSSSSDKRAADA